jgi:ADP-heptose:LPS heptosyltransferase
MIATRRSTPLRGRYLVIDPAAWLYLRTLDLALSAIVRSHPEAPTRPIRKLLIGVGGHLGDAVIASSVLAAIHEALPGVEIGLALSSPSLPVFAGHPLVRWMHVVDHWKGNRSAATWLKKRKVSTKSHAQALTEIRTVGYDASIDLYPFYPNKSVLFWRAGIPRRIGYESGGGGPACTTALPWKYTHDHVVLQHHRLVKELIGTVREPVAYDLPDIPATTTDAGHALLSEFGLEIGGYVVLHTGSGNSRKSWPREQWLDLIDVLSAEGNAVALTGSGHADRETINYLRARRPALIDLCDRTDLNLLRFVLRHATLMVGVDSSAVHLAAAEGTPCVSIMAGISETEHWRPLSPNAVVATHPVPCAPCFRSNGCAEMTCVRAVTAKNVLDALPANRLGTAHRPLSDVGR